MASEETNVRFVLHDLCSPQERRNARLLVPLTRGQGGAALQFEVEPASLDQLELVRHIGPGEDVGGLMQAFSAILLAPPAVEILRVDETPAS